jgi:hypothetical protein
MLIPLLLLVSRFDPGQVGFPPSPRRGTPAAEEPDMQRILDKSILAGRYTLIAST